MNKFYIHSIATIFFIFLCGLSLSSQEIKFTEEEKEWISNHQVIAYGYDPNWPPYEFYEDGIMKGVVAEYIKIIHVRLKDICFNQSCLTTIPHELRHYITLQLKGPDIAL